MGCEYHIFEEVQSLCKDWLRSSEILLDNAHMGNDRRPWKDVIGEDSPPNLNPNGVWIFFLCLTSTDHDKKKYDHEVSF